ncbi:MAG: PQQ-binding-like beta-propeller repeat protein [Planctomycetaceae bacterium]|nr:PQQ-binding-like beta-propeller repeat protein [Planctomycetaceae bacterium]MBT6154513.1 PQQ-binding-like beta-propeller repeat protein [Planctomycetaceae bacterium]MBT6486543.1 PQQ-binding-like beta-propeller repeat protein [Planctomycetaceae bacterium]
MNWCLIDKHFTTRSSLCSLVILLQLVVGSVVVAQQQVDRSSRLRETVSLDTDIAVTKKLKTAEDYLAAQQWEAAIEVLGGIIDGQSDTLVAASTGRYVSAGAYSHLLLSRLPADALALYRRKTDPQARQWFENGRQTRDASLLRRVLKFAYVGSYGDDALSLLGEWAWERGEIDTARRYWKQLSPADEQSPASLRFPDPQLGRADVLARLMLCNLAEGNFGRAERQRARIHRQFPDATGTLAGRTGRLADIAGALLGEAKGWTLPAPDTTAQTFAGTMSRQQILPLAVDIAAEQWSVQFSAREQRRFKFPSRQPAYPMQPAHSVHPLVHEGIVYFSDADRIYAYNLRTGKPAWPGPEGEEDNAVIYQLHDNLFPIDTHAAVGVPRFSMTIHDGRLYARMGTPMTSRSERELIADIRTDLVVLDLDPKRGQGKLLTKVSADSFGRGGAPWSFEGSPVVGGNRVYIALRRSQPQMQINVACFDSSSGRLIWNRRVCAAVSNIGRNNNLITHQLLTLAENKLFISTDLGAVAALDARDGAPLWVLTYESSPAKSPAVFSDHTEQGLLPCLFHQGTVYAAPNDSDHIFAIDAQSGVVKWQRRLGDRIRHLLGVGQGNLIVSGNSLWGLNAENGEVVWGRAITDPEFYGYGRGLLVDDAIWWPTRETIEIRSQRTGHRIRRQPIPLEAHGTTRARNTGGNLQITNGYLLVAQADRLVVYGESPLPVRPTRREISAAAPQRQRWLAKFPVTVPK